MRAACIVFPGSNADTEMLRTLAVVGIAAQAVWHRESALPPDIDLVAIPGGFSFGDYLRSGAIAKVSPIIADIRRHADRGGLVLGVCNGFQILTECGLLPGALTRNTHLRFESRDVFVKVAAAGPFTRGLGRDVLRVPIAHADGRYHIDDGGLGALKEASSKEFGDCVALRYCDAGGSVVADANPNGSIDAIAGIYGGRERNVLGLMPHPERMSEVIHGCEDGRLLFDAAIRSVAERSVSGVRGSA